MTILSKYLLEEALHFYLSQNCLKTLKEFHFGITSELVYIFYLITLQLHLIFNNNKKRNSFLLDQPPYSSELALGDFWLFPEWNPPSKLRDLCKWGSLRNVTLTLKN